MASRTLSATVPENSVGRCGTQAIRALPFARLDLAQVDAAAQDAARVGVGEPQQQ